MTEPTTPETVIGSLVLPRITDGERYPLPLWIQLRVMAFAWDGSGWKRPERLPESVREALRIVLDNPHGDDYQPTWDAYIEQEAVRIDEMFAALQQPAADPERVTVNARDLEQALDAMSYVMDSYFWEKWDYQEPYDRLRAVIQQREDETE